MSNMRSLALAVIIYSSSSLVSAAEESPSPLEVARQIDSIINAQLAELKDRGVEPARFVDDTAFLRRAGLTITGQLPTPEELTVFVLDPEPKKRQKLIVDLLATEAYSRNWARYWRAAILARSPDQRALRAAPVLEDWLDWQFRADRGWKEIATDLITAQGTVAENGNTGLILAQMGQAVELAAETSRLFLGIQIQCAQCHDHPYDKWTRSEFHELAAFYPRVQVRRATDRINGFEVTSMPVRQQRQRPVFIENPQRFIKRHDTNGNGQLEESEYPRFLERRFRRLVDKLDTNNDRTLSLDELTKIADRIAAQLRDRGEHYMPDLENPDDRGTLMKPSFFLNGKSPGEGLPDEERRRALADYLTADDNPWFAKALVNRLWAEMMGRGFVEPVDDMGPSKDVGQGGILDLLADGFTRNGTSLKWLFRTMAATEVYQRQGLPRKEAEGSSLLAGCYFTRMSPDQIFDALAGSLEIDVEAVQRNRGPGTRGLRGQFATLFDYDPSTPPDEVSGKIPQALFLMNSTLINQRIFAQRGVLRQIIDPFGDDNARVIKELYLRTLAREPTTRELKISLKYIEEVKAVKEVEDRGEALEDIFWCLLNSTEFITER